MKNNKRGLNKKGYFGSIVLFSFVLLDILTIGSLNENVLVGDKFIDQRIEKKFNINDSKVNVIIYLKDASKIAELSSNLSEAEFRFVSESPDIIAAEITQSGFEKLLNNQNINEIHFNSIGSVSLDISAPLINATTVWNNLNYTGNSTKICVIDSGVKKDHAYLSGKIKGEYCYCSLGGGCCPDGTSEDNNATDNNGHGTNVIGIIASQDSTYKGIAHGADIYAIRVTNAAGNYLESDLGKAINKCVGWNVSVISMSLGDNQNHPGSSICPSSINVFINNATSNNIFMDASSGNNGYVTGINYPACNPNVTSVGAVYDSNIGVGSQFSSVCTDLTTQAKKITCFTNRNSLLNLLAPGCLITSTGISGGTSTYCGTSQAAPHVAGAAALLLERNPNLTPNNITTILKSHNGSTIYDNATGLKFPLINALEAINSICTATAWINGSCGAGLCASTERQRTRTATPSACTTETDCISDASCVPGGGGGSSKELTVCASGCNYTKIGTAINNSDVNDRIFVTDNRTYNEQIKMNATTSGVLECKNASIIKGSNTGTGIYLKRGTDGFVVKNCNFDSFDYGVFVDNSSHGDLNNVRINNSQVIGFLLKDDTSDIRTRNISVLETTGDNAVRYDGYAWSASIVSYNLMEDSIIKKSSAAELIWIDYGIDNGFLRNNFSESASGYQGLLLKGHGNTGQNNVQGNNIFNNNWGIYLDASNGNSINSNIFCPSNNNEDITVFSSTSNGGSNNTCEKPGSWSDSETTGCTFFCDSQASTTLLYPLDTAIDTDGNVSLICQSDDNSQLVNVSLYHNISGSFNRNQTINISGTSNITTFAINNVPNQTIFSWNCLSYDNKSRGGFAGSNWTMNINILVPPPDDAHKFRIKNSSGNNVAWFGSWGNIVLGGNCTTSSNCLSPANSFIIRNSTDNTTAYIDNSGNLCIEKGDCSAQSPSCNPTRDAFIVKNSSNYNVSYIDYNGDLCLVGQLFENSEYL